MLRALLVLSLPCVLLPAVFGQAAPSSSSTPTSPPAAAAKSPASPDYKDEAGVFEQYDTTVRMQADGTGDRVDHVVLRIQSEGLVRGFGVLAVAYASATAKGSIEQVTVRKPDGTVVTTPASDAMEITPQVTREAPMYSDYKELQLPVRSLSVGDTLSYELHTVYTKAEAPGEFWGAERLLPFQGVVLSRSITLQVPTGKYVQVWSPKHTAQKTTANGTTTYVWHASQLKATPKKQADAEEDTVESDADKDIDEDAQGRKLPSLAWTTFHSWAEVGDWYRGLALARLQPDADLRARADALTRDAKTPQDQALALYNFVASQIRYVGIDLGAGRFQPHPAALVLSNQYGDCKDKDTLLEALLRAKGISAAPALIGAGITPVPDLPSPAVFNHVITTVDLPGGRVWLDTTAEVAPYGYLVPAIRDQEALVVPDKGEAKLIKSPAVPPFAFRNDFDAKGDLSADGVLHAQMHVTDRGDAEILLRAIARNLAPAEWDKGSQYLSNLSGFGGTTSDTRFVGANDLNVPMEITYTYTNKEYGNKDTHQIVPLFPAITLVSTADAKKEPQHDIDLGTPRTGIATSRIRIPVGWHIDLPDAVHEKSAWATIDKTYRFVAPDFIAERNVTVLQQKVPHAQWKDYQAFCKKADLGNEHWATLLPATASSEAKQAPSEITSKTTTKDKDGNTQITVHLSSGEPIAAAPADASMDDLKQTAFRQLQAGQVSAARATLDRIRAKNPNEPLLHAYTGWLDEQNGQYDEALAEYRKEPATTSTQFQPAFAIANLLQKQGKSAEARETLAAAFAKDPANINLGSALALNQAQAGQYTAAASTWQQVSTAHPDNVAVKVALGNALLAAGQTDAAAAVAKAALEGSDDPGVLNDAGYLLAETGSDLPEAEAVSRKSIAALDAKSRAIMLDQVNSNAFAQSNLLIAGWDTLGWILFKEGKLAEAEPYLVASWRNALHPEVGEHLGRLLEQKDDTAAAKAQFADARAAIEGNNASAKVKQNIDADLQRMKDAAPTAAQKPVLSDEARREIASIEANKKLAPTEKQIIIARITSGGPMSDAAHRSLQDMRTYHAPRAAGVKGWGTVRLQLTATGVHAVEQASGDPSLKAELPAIQKLDFPGLVPAGSDAYLLRSGVLSCSQEKTCDLVLVPNASLNTEQQQ